MTGARPLIVAMFGSTLLLACGANDARQGGVGGASSSSGTTSASTSGSGGAASLPILLAANAGQTCARMPDNALYCWGENDYGAFAVGQKDPNPHPRPVRIPGVKDVKELVLGWNFVCVLLTSGDVDCWGANGVGEVSVKASAVYKPKRVPMSGPATQIAAGNDHVCAVLADGSLWCWGGNDFAQLAVPMNVKSNPPLMALPNAVEVAAGSAHTCARLKTGEVTCWGGNEFGQLGSTSLSPDSTPAVVAGVTASLVAAGQDSTCAVTSNAVVCWGSNVNGELGVGTKDKSAHPTPSAVHGLQSADALALSRHFEGETWPGSHACALSNGNVWCWGVGASGELGIGSTPNARETPAKVTLEHGATAIAVGDEHACAALEDGSIWCWGRNDAGQLADTTTTERDDPVKVDFGACDGPGGAGTCEDCITCAKEDTCIAVYDYCAYLPDCFNVIDCSSICTDASCIDTCMNKYPLGKATAQMFFDCALCNACPTDCAAVHYACSK